MSKITEKYARLIATRLIWAHEKGHEKHRISDHNLEVAGRDLANNFSEALLAAQWTSVEEGLPEGDNGKRSWLVRFEDLKDGRSWSILHDSRTGDEMASMIKVGHGSTLFRCTHWKENYQPITAPGE